MKPEETLDYHFRKNWHGISRMYNAEAAKNGFTMSVGFALLSIDKDGTPSTHLGPKMGMEPRSLTRILKSLEEKNWIYKEPDKKDGRVVRIFLSEEGKRIRRKTRDAVVKFNKVVEQEIGAEDLETFFRVCKQVEEIVENNKVFGNE